MTEYTLTISNKKNGTRTISGYDFDSLYFDYKLVCQVASNGTTVSLTDDSGNTLYLHPPIQ